MITRNLPALIVICLLATGCAHFSGNEADANKPIHALLITGGCCHDYDFQSAALTNAIGKIANVEWTIVNEGGTTTRAQISFYDNPDWAKPYDIVVHNECFADTDDPAYIRKITSAHLAGKPAMVIHCAMHTYRAAKVDDWREFLGVTSRYHESQGRYSVKVVSPDHPAMRDFPTNWTSPMDELYVIEKLWPTAKALAVSYDEKLKQDEPVVWVNNYHGTRVFGTTFGHGNDTFRDPAYLNLLAHGFLWAAGKSN